MPAGYDEESGLEETPLVPGMSPVENSLRWGFVRKVHPWKTVVAEFRLMFEPSSSWFIPHIEIRAGVRHRWMPAAAHRRHGGR